MPNREILNDHIISSTYIMSDNSSIELTCLVGLFQIPNVLGEMSVSSPDTIITIYEEGLNMLNDGDTSLVTFRLHYRFHL